MALETENNAKRTPRSKKEQKEGYHACKKADIPTFGLEIIKGLLSYLRNTRESVSLIIISLS